MPVTTVFCIYVTAAKIKQGSVLKVTITLLQEIISLLTLDLELEDHTRDNTLFVI